MRQFNMPQTKTSPQDSSPLQTFLHDLKDGPHARLNQGITQLSTSLQESAVPKSVSSPWNHLERAVNLHLTSILNADEQIRSSEGEQGDLPRPQQIQDYLFALNTSHHELLTLADALRSAARKAGDLEGSLLEFLDLVDEHLMEEEASTLSSLGHLLDQAQQPFDFAATANTADSSESTSGDRVQSWNNGDLVRKTRGRCSDCLQPTPAQVLVRDEAVWLDKLCGEHGLTSQRLSNHPNYWGELDRFYFKVNAENYPQRDYIIRMTERCNLACPICLAKANTEDTNDISLESVRDFMESRRGIKIDLMAAEPTLRPDLEEWVRTVKAAGNIAALHTNGLKLAKRSYAERLKAAGVDEVFLQFDGFNDDANEVLRGRKLLKARMAALKNLRELEISTSLIVVIAKDLNEDEVGRTVSFAAEPENRFIKEVFFLGLRMLGSAADRGPGETPFEGLTLMPDDMIALLVEQQTSVKRKDILAFNKVYFAMLSLFKVKKCLYVQHYLMLRGPKGMRPISEVVDIHQLALAAEAYAVELPKSPKRARMRFAARLVRGVMRPKAFPMIGELARLQSLFWAGMNLDRVPPGQLLLGFITACDPDNFDSMVAVNCGKGELSMDGGFVESGAVANVDREARFLESDRRPGTAFRGQ